MGATLLDSRCQHLTELFGCFCCRDFRIAFIFLRVLVFTVGLFPFDFFLSVVVRGRLDLGQLMEG